MTESWGMDVARSIFATIDRAVYSIIALVYNLLLKISEVAIFSDNVLDDFATRAYALIGLIMLFKVTFSFINYIVNPEQINDKAKGAHKIIVNIVISLGLIIITPFVFDKLYELQTAILKDNLIPKFILGTSGDMGSSRAYKMSSEGCSEDGDAYANNDGDYISLIIFRPFYQIEPAKINSNSKDKTEYCQIGTRVGATVSQYLKANIYNDAPGGTKELYTIDYKFFVSTLVGIVVLLILVSFCFDVAVRAIKLGFLQIIAPIPIISYIDPNSSKNGMWKKYVKEVSTTFADLFVRLAALFFGVYVIKSITTDGLQDLSGNPLQNIFWVDLFLIIGALIFAKKLPQLLSDLLGIKIEGGLQLNPMKKIRDQALGGKAITGGLKGAAALGTGALLGLGANAYDLKRKLGDKDDKKMMEHGRKGWKAKASVIGYGARSLVGGAFSGATRSAYQGFKGDSFKKGVSSGLKETVDNRGKRDSRQKAGYKFSTRMADQVRGYAGVKTSAKKSEVELQNKIQQLQTNISNLGRQQEHKMAQGGMDAQMLNNLSSVMYNKDTQKYEFKIDGKTLGFKDLDIKGDFGTALKSGTFGTGYNSGNEASIAEYTELARQIKDLNKNLVDLQKQEAVFQKADAAAKK